MVSVSEKYRAGRRLLGSEDASFMPHRQPPVQSFQYLHSRPGIAGAFRTWQQLEGVQLESHRVVPGHSPPVLEAQDLFQAQLRVQRPECRLRMFRGNPESLVEPRQELLQHPVGFPDAARPAQTEFSYQPVLEGAPRSLHAALGLGRQGENHLNPQFLHGPAELGWHPGEAGAGRVPEDPVLDPVPVGVESVDHRAGGIVYRDQQRERRRLVPQPRVMTAVHLDQHALPGWTLRKI